MNLYLIRHGIAEDHGFGKSDFDRELTHEGKKKMEAAVKGWKNLIDGFDYLISSPLIRARQTAEIVKDIFKIENEIVIDKRLIPGSRTDKVIDIINEIEAENIALFGHEPDFSEHVSNLISSSGALINFRKGAIAKIYFGGKARLSNGTLDFFIPTKAYLK